MHIQKNYCKKHYRKEVTLYGNADLDYLVGKEAEASSAFDDVIINRLYKNKLSKISIGVFVHHIQLYIINRFHKSIHYLQPPLLY